MKTNVALFLFICISVALIGTAWDFGKFLSNFPKTKIWQFHKEIERWSFRRILIFCFKVFLGCVSIIILAPLISALRYKLALFLWLYIYGDNPYPVYIGIIQDVLAILLFLHSFWLGWKIAKWIVAKTQRQPISYSIPKFSILIFLFYISAVPALLHMILGPS